MGMGEVGMGEVGMGGVGVGGVGIGDPGLGVGTGTQHCWLGRWLGFGGEDAMGEALFARPPTTQRFGATGSQGGNAADDLSRDDEEMQPIERSLPQTPRFA